MNQFYWVCAVLGGTVIVCQFLLGLLGFGEHHDLDGSGGDIDHGLGGHDAGGHDASAHDGGGHDGSGHDGAVGQDSLSSWFVGVLSFRTVIAGITFLGLTGLAAHAQGVHPAGSLALALAAGTTALYAVAWTMRSLSRLRADGTARIRNAVGSPAVVYLAVPGHRAGKGKVTVSLQNRTMEYAALTDHDALPTGASVQVVAIVDSETVAVEAAPVVEEPNHA